MCWLVRTLVLRLSAASGMARKTELWGPVLGTTALKWARDRPELEPRPPGVPVYPQQCHAHLIRLSDSNRALCSALL